jgi:hypothetical protein
MKTFGSEADITMSHSVFEQAYGAFYPGTLVNFSLMKVHSMMSKSYFLTDLPVGQIARSEL